MDRCCRRSSEQLSEWISISPSAFIILSRVRRIKTYQSQDCSRRRHRQQRRTLEIKLTHRIKDASPRALQPDIIWDHDRGHGHAQEQRRDLDAKLPSPAERLGHGAAEGSSEGRAGAEIDGDIGLVGASASDGESASQVLFSKFTNINKRENTKERETYSIGTRSLVMILPSAATPPAPSPQSALAAMKLSILPAKAHPIVATVKTPKLAMNKGFLPIASDNLPSSG